MTSDGSEFVSTRATIGMPRRRASSTAIYSVFVSTTNRAAGRSLMLRRPSKLRCIRAISRRIAASSFLLASLFMEPSVSMAR